MMINNESIQESYLNWMASIVMPNQSEYYYLLKTLYNTNFKPSMKEDINRVHDGIALRQRFADVFNYTPNDISFVFSSKPCSLLEMMVSLSIRIEESIMSNYEKGDRTWVWFKQMLLSLDLLSQTNDNFDVNYIMNRIFIFDQRIYEPNGHGGLFTISNPTIDMRNYEIWYQMTWYINEVDNRLEHYSI